MVSMDLTGGGLRIDVDLVYHLLRLSIRKVVLKITGNSTDCAVKGSGLFIVSEPSSDTLQTAGKMYTRVGALGFDKDGYFATRDGGRIQGYVATNNGELTTRLSDVRIETTTIPPSPTKKVTLNVQLDSQG